MSTEMRHIVVWIPTFRRNLQPPSSKLETTILYLVIYVEMECRKRSQKTDASAYRKRLSTVAGSLLHFLERLL
jgi:hypothetical protein